jgi:unsaturated chondroitin disaccharide hydrolase
MKMKKVFFLFIALAMISFSCNTKSTDQTESESSDIVLKVFQRAEVQLGNAVSQYQDLTLFPRSSNPDGTLIAVPAKNWVSGFFPGSLWYLYEFTEDEKWKSAAVKWTEALNEVQFHTGTHDVGFVINCSYGNGLRLSGEESYKPVMIQTAKSLSTRYNENVGCTKSWDWSNKWKFPVIVDNMMNLELLFEATKLSGDESFKNIAIDHANTTMEHHFRPDYSSWHVVDYDPETGEVLEKVTHQGISDDSAWARGQAWGLYGYVFCFREIKDQKYLDLAENIAQFIINHPNTPDDLVPYWDYDAPGIPDEPRDASAAALIASAFLELSTYSSQNGAQYFSYAERILESLSSDEYLAAPGTNNNFILKHCTGHKPQNSEVDAPLAYGDYYFLEALLRYKKLRK